MYPPPSRSRLGRERSTRTPLDVAGYPVAMLSIARDLRRAATGASPTSTAGWRRPGGLDELPATEPARQPTSSSPPPRRCSATRSCPPGVHAAAPQRAEWRTPGRPPGDPGASPIGDRTGRRSRSTTGCTLARVPRRPVAAEDAALLGERARSDARSWNFTALNSRTATNDVWLGWAFPTSRREPFGLEATTCCTRPTSRARRSTREPDRHCGILLDEWVVVIPGDEGDHRPGLPLRPAEQRGAPGDAARHATRLTRRLAVGRPGRRHSTTPSTSHGCARSTRADRRLALGPFLPATAVERHRATRSRSALNYGFNNDLPYRLMEADFE